MGDALRQLSEAILNSQELDDPTKREAADLLQLVAKQAEQPPEKRSAGLLKAAVSALPTTIAAAKGLVDLWNAVGPHITHFFGPLL